MLNADALVLFLQDEKGNCEVKREAASHLGVE